jgi:drug/metabolite transporter (DMT)-like permease
MSAAAAAAAPRAGSPGRAALLMLAATLLFASMNATAKALGPGYSPVQLICFRNLFALLPLAFGLWQRGASLDELRARRPLSHVMRSLVGLASLGCYFYAFPRLPLATVTAISFAAPICVAALSRWLLGEHVGPRRVAAILTGFGGVLVILRPTVAGLDLPTVVTVLATLLYALVMIFMRRLNRTETPSAIVFYYLVTSILLSGLALPFYWTTPDLRGWLLLLALGFSGGFGQIAMTTAFRHADAAFVAPFDYTSILWASGIGWLVWGELPGGRLWLGVAIIIASGLYITQREARLRRAARRDAGFA